MDAASLLLILLLILGVNFALEQGLRLLNLKAMGNQPATGLEEVYAPDQYLKSQAYNRVQARLALVNAAISFVVMAGLLWWGGFGWLDGFLRQFVTHPLGLALTYFGVLVLVADLASTPLSLYATFVIEAKYGFNKMSFGTWLGDKFKSMLIGVVVGVPLLSLLLWLIETLGPNFWLFFWGVAVLVLLLVNFLYTALIVPLFNKLTPLEEGPLRAAIEAYARKVNFPLDKIMVMDGSKRSSKANAFFSGFGKMKRVVLYDTLIEQQSTDELVSIFAHEVGHYKKKHTLLGFVLSALQIGLMLFILSIFVGNEELSFALGASQASIHLSLIAFGMLYSPVSSLIGLGMNLISRKNEYAADQFATETSDGHAMIRALKKLAANNLSNLSPHPAFAFYHFSHPPLKARIDSIQAHQATKEASV